MYDTHESLTRSTEWRWERRGPEIDEVETGHSSSKPPKTEALHLQWYVLVHVTKGTFKPSKAIKRGIVEVS